MIAFIVGMFIGSLVGVTMMALCAVSGKCSDMEERDILNERGMEE